MSNGSAREVISREQLSALADGELESAAVAAACAAWKEDPALRSTWHSYQLIGDVLRSDDLASVGERDRAFMASLRARLACEPVPLAPSPSALPSALPLRGGAMRRARWGWAAPSAIAAGFAAVAGVLMVTRAPAPAPTAPAAELATIASPLTTLGVTDALSLASAPLPTASFGEPTAPTQTFVRDPQIDRYLDAHKQFAGRSALGMPSGYLRHTLADVPGR